MYRYLNKDGLWPVRLRLGGFRASYGIQEYVLLDAVPMLQPFAVSTYYTRSEPPIGPRVAACHQ